MFLTFTFNDQIQDEKLQFKKSGWVKVNVRQLDSTALQHLSAGLMECESHNSAFSV